MNDPALTPTEALGVALSVASPKMLMQDAQDAAPAMLAHLRAMGFDVGLLDAETSSEEYVTPPTTTLAINESLGGLGRTTKRRRIALDPTSDPPEDLKEYIREGFEDARRERPELRPTPRTLTVLGHVQAERVRQTEWAVDDAGKDEHDWNGLLSWRLSKVTSTPDKRYVRLIQLAACAVAAAEEVRDE